jgi:hypothetical protein
MTRCPLAPLAALLIALPVLAQTPPATAPDTSETAAPARPDWMPAALALPAGARITNESAVGSLLRMVSVEIPGASHDLLSDWRRRLADDGFAVDDPGEVLDDAPIVFSGKGIRTGQVVLLPGTSDRVTLIQIDVTLDT